MDHMLVKMPGVALTVFFRHEIGDVFIACRKDNSINIFQSHSISTNQMFTAFFNLRDFLNNFTVVMSYRLRECYGLCSLSTPYSFWVGNTAIEHRNSIEKRVIF